MVFSITIFIRNRNVAHHFINHKSVLCYCLNFWLNSCPPKKNLPSKSFKIFFAQMPFYRYACVCLIFNFFKKMSHNFHFCCYQRLDQLCGREVFLFLIMLTFYLSLFYFLFIFFSSHFSFFIIAFKICNSSEKKSFLFHIFI